VWRVLRIVPPVCGGGALGALRCLTWVWGWLPAAAVSSAAGVDGGFELRRIGGGGWGAGAALRCCGCD